jgi:hypothetical protein
MFKIFALLQLVKPFIVWRNPNMTAIVAKHNHWTLRQLYLDEKGERAQRKVLQMAVRQSQKG